MNLYFLSPTSLFLIFIISINYNYALNQNELSTIVKYCDFDRTYTYDINNSVEYIFLFNNATKISARSPARITIQSSEANKQFPVLIVVRQQKGVLSWQLPYIVEATDLREEYHMVSRTLCPVSNYYRNLKPSLSSLQELNSMSHQFVETQLTQEEVIVSVSSASEVNVTFSMSASVEEDFYVDLGDERRAYISPSEPRYFAFQFPEDVNTILLEANSNDDICMTISIQNITCPVFDLEGNVQFEGLWQTMTRKGGVTLTRERFPAGFFLVFVVRGDDTACLGETASYPDPTSRHKNITFSLRKKISYDEYLVATFGAFGVFLLFYLVSFIVVVVHSIKNRDREDDSVILPVVAPEEEEECLSPDEEDKEQDFLWHKINSGQPVFVSDISRQGCKNLRKGSQMYLWNLLTVATFYSLPVVQLVITYQRVLNNTGNQDLCFYNFLCSHPVGVLSDFNHVYSNLGYGMLGLLFVLLTYRRERLHINSVVLNPALDQHYGLPQQFGLFYAMGAALISEGILSACYHVCPNYSNFQFDTSFMYVIAMMCMLRIYQNRHPDIHASAYTTFGALAGVIFLGMIGVLTGTPIFWSIFTAIHIFTCLLLSAQVYYMGCWSLDFKTLRRVLTAYTPSNNENIYRCIRPIYPKRMVLLFIGNMVNIALAVLGILYHPKNFASYLLAIFMSNLNIYCWFYIIMKLVHKERIKLQPLIYIIMSFILWGLSLNYFFHKSISWSETPALSRTFNRPCNVLDFYDNHDIWHFLSASSMFSSFMVLLTLDDNLIHVPRNQISVF